VKPLRGYNPHDEQLFRGLEKGCAVRRVSVLLGPRPKVPEDEVVQLLNRLGFTVSRRQPDFGIVVGGDGLFSYFGRTADYPLLFVGFRGTSPTSSRANLAQVEYGGLEQALKKIIRGEFVVEKSPLLSVSLDGREIGVAFTDTYVERGLEPGCLRYEVHVETPREAFTDFAVSNGVIVSTPAGATGYYSYPDKLHTGGEVAIDAHTRIPKGRLGVCHILPTYTVRVGTNRHPLRYTVPISSKITIQLKREADARLYGVGSALNGYPLTLGQAVTVKAARRRARIILLKG
jgi:hypothetical protein